MTGDQVLEAYKTVSLLYAVIMLIGLIASLRSLQNCKPAIHHELFDKLVPES